MTNLVARSGETFRRQLQLTDEDGNPTNLSGMTVEGQIRLFEGAPALATFGYTTQDEDGIINLYLSPTQTRKIRKRLSLWDVWLVSGSDRTLLEQGKFILKQSATASGGGFNLQRPTWGDAKSRTWGQAALLPWGAN